MSCKMFNDGKRSMQLNKQFSRGTSVPVSVASFFGLLVSPNFVLLVLAPKRLLAPSAFL